MKPFPQYQQTQTNMSQPPNMFTTKDHLYMKDMLSWNLNAMKKAYHFSQLCQDQDVKMALDRAWQMHERHYRKLLNHLQNHHQQPMLNNNQQPTQQPMQNTQS